MRKEKFLKEVNRLKGTKTNLKAHKVALSIVDDIEQESNRFEQAESEASYLAYDWGDEIIDAYDDFRLKYNIDDYIINGATRDLEEVSEIMREHLEKIRFAAEEIGIDPNDIYFNYDDLRQRVDNAESLNTDAKSKYFEVTDYAGFNNFWN
tara:strand:+ start:190 stop:642 length:453 start_codon:yes stop_codon:yes gene_type:complete